MQRTRKASVVTYPGRKKAPPSLLSRQDDKGVSSGSVVEGDACSVCGLVSHRTEDCGLIAGAAKVRDALCPPKAILTLPSCVEYKNATLGGGGDVVCKCKVAKGTQFGPLDAPTGPKLNAECAFVLKVTGDTGDVFYDTSDKSKCNWMTLVRFSEDESQINCVCYQLKDEIYFSVMKDVGPGIPLVVGYSKGYQLQLQESAAQKELRQLAKQEVPDLAVSNEESEMLQRIVPGESESKKYRDHDYIHLNAKKAQAAVQSRAESLLKKSSANKLKRNKSVLTASESPSIRENVEGVRKSPRKSRPTAKGWNYLLPNEDLGVSEFESDAPEERAVKEPEKSVKRLKKVKVIRVLEKWICKFCHKTVPDVELFTSHLIDHYKSVGWNEGEGKSADSEQIDEDSKQITEPSQPYTCDICLHPKEFNKLDFIIRHLTNHLAGLTRTEDQSEDNSSNFGTRQCSICGKSFFSSTRLQTHVDVNHGQLARCKRCRRTFTSDDELKFHACRHFKCATGDDVSVLLKCDVCEETFAKSSSFEKHAMSHDPVAFTCPICCKSLTNENRKLHCALCFTVQNFMSLNLEEMMCPCLKCEKTFRTMENFQDHVSCHTHPLMCQCCRMRFRTTDDIQQHVCKGIVCDGCEHSFPNLDNLVAHIKSSHAEPPSAYCFECAVPFATKEGYDIHGDCEYQHDVWLKPHEPSDQSTEAGRYICEMCGAAYNKWSSMKTHRKTHGPRVYVCDQCGKSFHRKELLADHINVHDDAKFKCECCHKMFKSKKSLEVHMRIHNGIKPYSCATCGRAFTQRVNLRAHEVTHLPEDQKGFPCPYEDCDKKFATKEYLKFHMEIHGQGTSIACEVCGKQFYRMHILNRHKRTAHGNHKYKCEFCVPPLFLRQKHNLFRHLQRLHENFKEVWSGEGYADKIFIPGDGNYSHPSVKSRMSKLLPPTSSKPEETVLRLQEDGTAVLNQEESMTVMISGSMQDAEGEIEIQSEEVIIEQDQGNEIQILGLPESQDGQTSMVLLQLDNSGNYVIAFPTHVTESVQLLEELE